MLINVYTKPNRMSFFQF